jgi:hypothetical protein
VKIRKWVILLIIVFILFSFSLLLGLSSNSQIKIEIVSYVVRDRIIPLKRLEMRSMIIVGFKIVPKLKDLTCLIIKGELYWNNELISKDEISNLDFSGNNLGFDIPLAQGDFDYNKLFGIPEGKYMIIISLYDQHHQLLAQCKKELNRNQIGRRFYGFDKIYNPPHYIAMNNKAEKSKPLYSKTKINKFKHKDYIVFQKNYLERVYPYTEPHTSEFMETIYAEISRNEYQPNTFYIRSFRNLGKVKVTVTPPLNQHGNLGTDPISIGTISQLTEIVETEKGGDITYYRWAPKIIESKEVTIPQGSTQGYWITLKAGADTTPGDYRGVITIRPQFGRQTQVPIHVKVLPLRLTDTDIQYGMMMTYAFYELDNDRWTQTEKALIKQQGIQIYRDLREHGMTVIYPHSHFFLKFDGNGQPILHSLKASLEYYKKLKFPGPFCWYLGHLLQTAKPSHPGSIDNYDAEVVERRLRQLLNLFEAMAKELGIPKEKLIVQLVDEPDDRERISAGKELNRIAREMGVKTLVTRDWPELDAICTGIPGNNKEAQRLKKTGKQWWIYPNDALDTKNMSYTRYVFGFGAWRWGVDGVVPWTFQMSQGCNGNPFTILDGPEVMVAYPGVKGPIPTPTWEAIRDGINDYKYIYLLKRLISDTKGRDDTKANLIEQKLQQFKQDLGRGPGEGENQFGDWPPDSFSKRRKQIIEWALELYRSIPGMVPDN